MSSSGIDKNQRVDQTVEPTGDLPSVHNTADDAASTPTSKPLPLSDPLLALLRPPQADGELGRLAGFAVKGFLGRGGTGRSSSPTIY